MKKNSLLITLLALIFSGILFNDCVAQHFPTPEGRQYGPPFPVPPTPGEMRERMGEMMHRFRTGTEFRGHCKTLMQAPLFLDSPAVIRAQSASLNLSSDQIQKLDDIENEARRKAKSLLNTEQLKKLGNMPEKPVVIGDACLAGMLPAAEELLQKIIRDQSAKPEPESKLDDTEKKTPVPAK